MTVLRLAGARAGPSLPHLLLHQRSLSDCWASLLHDPSFEGMSVLWEGWMGEGGELVEVNNIHSEEMSSSGTVCSLFKEVFFVGIPDLGLH